MSRTSLKIERLTVIGLTSVISNCNRFSFTIASVTLEKEPTVLQIKELRLTQASDVASKSVLNRNSNLMISLDFLPARFLLNFNLFFKSQHSFQVQIQSSIVTQLFYLASLSK